MPQHSALPCHEYAYRGWHEVCVIGSTIHCSFNQIDSEKRVEAESPLDLAFNGNQSTKNNSFSTTHSADGISQLDTAGLFPAYFSSTSGVLGAHQSSTSTALDGGAALGSGSSLDSINQVPSYDPNELELLQSDKDLESMLNFAIGDH